jgi:hypothetical protein
MWKKIQETKFVDSETMSPEKYLNLSDRYKMNISQTRIIPAQLGKKDFGKIQVIYRMPVLGNNLK